MMADTNKNFVANNVIVESDELIKFVNPFRNHRQNQIEDFSLFLNMFKKCRCCFGKLINDYDQHTVKPWHRQAFFALTGVEMSIPDSENFICLKCADVLMIYTELGKTAGNLQRSYYIFIQDLASDIKTEKDYSNENSGRLQDYSDIVIHDESVSNEENSETIESRAKVKECTIRLTRIDADSIDKYEYYSIIGGTKEQTIDEISTTSAKLKRTTQNIKKCHICGLIVTNKTALCKHYRKAHTDTMRFSCDLCGTTFSHKQKAYFIAHMNTHKLKVKFNCTLCPVDFQSNSELSFHENKAHNKKLKCEKCDATFKEPCRLKEHVKKKHEDKRYICQIPGCSKSYLSIDNARHHLLKEHSFRGEEEYRKYRAKFSAEYKAKSEVDLKCEICGKILKTRGGVRSHNKHIHKKNKGCDYCGETFSDKINLIDHMQTHHMNLKLSCNLCSLEYRSDRKLRRHKQLAHHKNFNCHRCNLAFGVLFLLKEHVKVKHEGKRYHCNYPGCSSLFSQKTNASKHLNKQHLLFGENFNKFHERLTLQ